MKLQTKRKILECARRLLRLPEDSPLNVPQQTVIHYDVQVERACAALPLDRFQSSTRIDGQWEPNARRKIACDIALILEEGDYIEFNYTQYGALRGTLTVAKPPPIEYRGEQLTWRKTDIGREILQREREYDERGNGRREA